MIRTLLIAALATAGVAAWLAPLTASAADDPRGDATRFTVERQKAGLAGLNVDDPGSFEDARRGFIAAPSGQILDEQGKLVWDFAALAFTQGEAPATVNPSLWRQAKLNHQPGLYKVTEGIWQLRGFDLANLTVIQGKSGWILVDPLTTQETAAAALAFARKHLGEQRVTGVVFTHSHVDHFGGALGVLSAKEAADRRVPVVAPVGFMEEATSENVLVGPAMSRRAGYMYGGLLPKDARGLVDTGLGVGVAAGRIGILPPTVLVDQPSQAITIDGVRFVFHNVPGTEAPAEMTFELPELRAFGAAELVSQTMHNLYTLRGAKVRDSLSWSRFIDEAIGQTADKDVVFLQHGWPVWGRERIDEFMVSQRDTYRYLHDQTVRLINAGKTPSEIAEEVRLPASLARMWSSRGYYGTGEAQRPRGRAVLRRLVRRASLESGSAAAGGGRETLRRAGWRRRGRHRGSRARPMGAGDYRWAAELLRHVVPRTTRRRRRRARRRCWPGASSSSAMRPSRRRGATSI
ncbi:metallo-beta-lactamase superfamily domain-containing protein [Ditylenchus destructor]|nr:metallo-beta-lactamase superfamily domain-containing protein [Ditylenchus destructor]